VDAQALYFNGGAWGSDLQQYSFDREYVQRLEQGDAATEAHFYQYFGDLVLLKARARLSSAKETSEDVRQETLIRVLVAIRQGRVEHPERIGAFVNTVCNNVILEILRRSHRLSQFPETATDIASGEVSAERNLMELERKLMVRRALEELDPKDQQLLRRIVLEEHDKDLVCNEFQVSREYLRVLLHRATHRLKAALTKGYAGGQ
jgi:RNA polymerase sigma-70 factor (ECF subfamily)